MAIRAGYFLGVLRGLGGVVLKVWKVLPSSALLQSANCRVPGEQIIFQASILMRGAAAFFVCIPKNILYIYTPWN